MTVYVVCPGVEFEGLQEPIGVYATEAAARAAAESHCGSPLPLRDGGGDWIPHKGAGNYYSIRPYEVK